MRSEEGNPPHVDCSSDCAWELNNEIHGNTITLYATVSDSRSYLQRWEGCNTPGAQITLDGKCRLDLNLPSAVYTVCAVFNVRDAPPVADPTCPPMSPSSPPAPPPPPPSGPPPLGSPCTISGSAGANVIDGTAGRDVICGRGGDDRINGRGGHDLILGGTGADRLTGGGGRDAIYGGSGNDTLSARDGVRDTVNGGRGRDHARWDARDVRRSIERRL